MGMDFESDYRFVCFGSHRAFILGSSIQIAGGRRTYAPERS